MKKLAILIVAVLMFSGCAESDNVFTNIGTTLATPSAMWIDVPSNRLYVVNSNSEVLYNYTQGTFQVYDITAPLAPVLIKTVVTNSFSGEIYVDTTAKFAYSPNRYSSSNQVTSDILYKLNIDETSPNFFAAPSESPLDINAYAIYCCYPANRAWITTSNNNFQYVDLSPGADLTPGNLSLVSTLSTGDVINNAAVNHIAVISSGPANNRAFLSAENGGILVVNLDLAGVAGSVPVNYFVNDIAGPNGIATDGTNVYVAGSGNIDDAWTNYLIVLNAASVPATTTNTNTIDISSVDSGMRLAVIPVGNNPQEVLLSTKYAFVTNQDDDTVSVIDLVSRTVVSTITVGDMPFSLALYTTPGGVDQYVYVGNVTDNSISIIDIPTLSVVATYK